MAKDPDDASTLEMPFIERPIQVMERVILQKQFQTPNAVALFLQNIERKGLATSDLEMLIAIRDYRAKHGCNPIRERLFYVRVGWDGNIVYRDR